MKTLFNKVRFFISVALFLAMALGLALPMQTVRAATITVCASGCDYTTIQEAIIAASPGDTINVAAGTYVEQLLVQKSLTIAGAGAASTNIQAPAIRTGSVTEDGRIWDYIVAAYPTSGTINVRIEGFTIDANNQNKTAETTNLVAVFFRDVSGTGAGLFSSKIQGFPAIPDYESYGVKVYGNSVLSIDNNAVSSYTRDGIGVKGGLLGNPSVVINNNTVTGSAVPLNAIYLGDGATGSITGNTVKNHTRSLPWAGAGIWVNNSNSVPVTGNTVEDTFYAIAIVGSTSSTVSGNTLKYNINRHILLDNSHNTLVSFNMITGTVGGTEDAAINLLNGSAGNTIQGNTITLATSDSWVTPPILYGVWIGGGSPAGGNTIQSNTISGGRRGIQVDSGTTGTTTIANNAVSNTPTGPNYPIWGIGINGGSVNILSNTLTNTVRPVEFWGAASVNVDGNTINGAIYDGINLGSASGTKTIKNNKIYNIPGSYGIKVRGGNNDVVIEGNEIYNSYSGILTESNVSGTQITSNYIHDNTWGSVFINNAAGTIATIMDNTIKNNARGIEANPGGGTIVAHYNNLVDNTYGGLFLYSSGTFTFDNNWWGNPSGPNVGGSGPGTGAAIVTNGNTALTYAPWVTGLAVSFSTPPGPFPYISPPTITPTATLTNSTGPLPGVSVSFYLDSILKGTAVTDVSGEAIGPAITLPSAAGVYDISAVALGGCLREEGLYALYDPAAGFVTGGSWIMSPAGAYTANPGLTGKATFGFVAKYKKGANVPDGNTEFQFKAGDLNFKSTSYEWLVVAGTNAKFKGVGTINGQGTYKFMITADDSRPDYLRIQIWDARDGLVYDNGPQQSLGGGSIVIHK